MRHLLPVLALSIALTACTAVPTIDPSPTVTPSPTVDPADLVTSTFVHLEDLQKVADDAGGSRATGTEGYAGSLAYAERVLTAAGFTVTRQEAEAPGRRPPADEPGATVPVVNLIAEGPAAPSGRVVMLGAHLDSVGAGPGINDNASGVALTLALAEQLAAEDGAAGLRVALWDAEELGLLGSGAYLRGLAPDEVGRISAYINLDMVASPNGLVGIYGDGPARRALEQPLRDRGRDYEGVSIDGASDHAWFDGQGISVAGLYTGAGESLSAAESEVFGGTADAARDVCYHRACDTVASVDTPEVRSRLLVIADASLQGLRTLLGEVQG